MAEPYRGVILRTCTLDDQLWHQSMVTHCYLRESRRFAAYRSVEAKVLHDLIYQGTADAPMFDNPCPSSTRSMRFAAVVGDRLWAIVEEEQHRVSPSIDLSRRGVGC